MKFSIRSLAIFVVFLSLAAAAITSSCRVRKLEEKLIALCDSHGMYTLELDETGNDHWELVSIGDFHHDYSGTSLLRVMNYEKYKLRVHFFDGTTDEYKTDVYKLESLATAIRLLPSENVVYVHETTTPRESSLRFNISATERVFDIRSKYSSRVVSNKPVFAYAMLTDPSNQPRGRDPARYSDSKAKIEEVCRKHKMKIVWFTIEPVSD